MIKSRNTWKQKIFQEANTLFSALNNPRTYFKKMVRLKNVLR